MTDESISDIRRRNMAAVKGRNTSPELTIRKLLHSQGFRFRLHNKYLPGSPDIVLKKYNALIFVNGCFWHVHHCPRFSWPKTREDFWKDKLAKNVERDRRNLSALEQLGYRVAVVWECALRGKGKLPLEELILPIETWLRSSRPFLEIEGS